MGIESCTIVVSVPHPYNESNKLDAMTTITTFSYQALGHVAILIACIVIGRFLARRYYASRQYDPLKMRKPAFYFGLAWSLLLVIYAFDISTVSTPYAMDMGELPPELHTVELVNHRVKTPVVAKQVKYIPPVIDSIIFVDEDPIDTIIQKVKPIIDVADTAPDNILPEPSGMTPIAPPAPPPLPVEPEVDDTPHIRVEEMPRFPTCESDELTRKEKVKCANAALMQYVYQSIKYPAFARENGIEGSVVVQFVIDREGAIRNAELKRDIGGGCGKEVMRILDKMQNDVGNWTPGRQQGRRVPVLFTLPVKFALDD